MFGNKITKTIKVEGMHCMHCANTVETALKEVSEVKKAKVDLDKKIVEVTLNKEVENDVLYKAIKESGFEPVEE